MTLEGFYDFLTKNSLPIGLLLLVAPFMILLLCRLIPGRKEEPLLLSINLGLAILAMALWAGYLAYISNAGGWDKLAKEADFLLLLAPPVYAVASLWVSRQRLPLNQIPAFRTLQGLAMLVGVFLFFGWLGQRIHIVLFSKMPFSTFLFILALLLVAAYLGYRRMIGGSRRQPR
jgi:hypothetical protein